MNAFADIRESLGAYLKDEIIPRYACFDSAHREDHAQTVICQAMKLLDRMEPWLCGQAEDVAAYWKSLIPGNGSIDREVLITAAACHDLGLKSGRERHHIDSGAIIRSDARLQEWFNPDEIEIIAQAAEDHRASGKSAPRSIYGMIVAEADRVIDGETIIRRTIQFGLNNYPGLDREGHLSRAISHLHEKYGRGGYLKLWIPWSDNAARLAELQETIADDSAIFDETVRIYESLV